MALCCSLYWRNLSSKKMWTNTGDLIIFLLLAENILPHVLFNVKILFLLGTYLPGPLI